MRGDLIDRRIFLVAGSAWLAAGCGSKPAATCVKEDELTSSERSLRASLQYTDVSPDTSKRCSGCAFFKSSDASCGHCEMLSGVVSATGRCASWSARK
jgi:High potential iron-sulfur protein